MSGFSFRSNRAYPTIPTITGDIKSHTAALQAMAEALAVHERRTKDLDNSFVRVKELVDLGLITLSGDSFNVIGVGLSEIAGVGDLSVSAEGDFLRYRFGAWINDQLEVSDISEIMVTQHQAALDIGWGQLIGLGYGSLKDVLQSAGGSNTPQWVASGPRYLTQVVNEYYWVVNEFVRGQNVIGVRYSGPTTLYLPSDLPTEYLISVKDEVGAGDITVRVY